MDISSEKTFLTLVYPRLLVFGSHVCHQRNERSLYFGIRKFPVCARCTGIYLATPLGILSTLLPISYFFYIALALPMVIDGVLQLLSSYESTNLKRLITGSLFGVAYGALIVFCVSFAVRLIFN